MHSSAQTISSRKDGQDAEKRLRKQKKRAIKTAQMRHLKNLLSTHFKMVCDYQMLIRPNAYPGLPDNALHLYSLNHYQ